LGKLDLRDFNPDAREANLWNREQLGSEELAYLEALPEMLVKEPFTLTHGSPRHPIWEYVVYAPTALEVFGHFETPVCFVGHTHTPAIFRLSNQEGRDTCESVPLSFEGPLELGASRAIINPGSVGQPRDGDPRASYAILDAAALTIEHRRTVYPVDKTQAKMMEHDLPLRLVLRLAYGW
jgi:diadenosine tetraphosphatase ApaH/serine/threonine PP2A family protein phosphatase